MKTPHYLRFAQALALAAFVPGCIGTEDSDPAADSQTPATQSPIVADEADASSSASATPVLPAVRLVAVPDEGAGGAGGKHPFSSGPIVPPELPRGFA